MVVSYAGELLKESDGKIYERDLEVRVTDEHGLALYSITVIATEAPIARRELAGGTG